jgi:RNA polymerase sigma factor (sigma-70 family)
VSGKRDGILGTLAAPGVSATARSRTDVTDQELVQAVRAGDDHAFERLYHRYHRRIAAYLFGMVRDHGRAEDLTQEVFVSALRRMRQTERPIAFKPWIYEIAKNASIDAFRRAKRTEEVSYDADEGLGAADQVKLAATSQSPDAAIGTKESLDHLCGAFGGLSDAHHQILVLRELEGLSYREIGDRLGMSRASVESTLFRARRRLTEEYEELVTGERCLRIQGIIAGTAAGRALGLRDTRRVGSHIFHCQPCRRQAVLAGLDAAVLARRPVRGKIAALLPLPAFLRRRWLPGGSGDAAAQAAVGGHGVSLAQVSMTAAQYGEPTMSGWMKGAAVATAVAVAGVGTGAVDHGRGAGARHDGGAAAVAAAAAAAQQQRSVAAMSGAGAATASGAGARGARTGAGAAKGATQASGGRRLRASAGTVVRRRPASETQSSSGSGAGSGGGAGGSTGAGSGSGAGSGTGSGSSSGGSSGASSPSGTTASTKPQGTKGSSGATSTGTGAVQQTASDAGSTAGDATGAATGAATGSSQQPLIQPDLTKLTQPPADAAPPTSVGGVVSGATDAVGGTVGGQVGTVVQETGQAVGDTVDDVTDGVGAVLGGLLGQKK